MPINNPPPLPNQPVDQTAKKSGCLGILKWVAIGFVVLVIFGMFIDGPKEKWADQKGEMLPKLEEYLEAGNFDLILKEIEEFKSVNDPDLEEVRIAAKSGLAEQKREETARRTKELEKANAERFASLKKDLDDADKDSRITIIAALERINPDSVELSEEYAELAAHRQEREEERKKKGEEERIAFEKAEEVRRKANEIKWSEISDIYSIKSKATDLKKDALWEKYKGKRVRWTGAVSSVSKGIFGGLTMQVKMSPDTFTSDLLINLKKSEEGKAINYSEGDRVTFEGILSSWGTILPITLKDGVILE